MADKPLKLNENKEEQNTLPVPQFLPQLIDTADPDKLQDKVKDDFKKLELELQSMRIEMAEVPTTESLVKLYSIQSKGRAYYERSEEIFRQYLKFLSTVTLLEEKANMFYEQELNKATAYYRKAFPEEVKNTKSGDERTALFLSVLPDNLKQEKMKWHVLASLVKTNFTILKSYRDQFKSINDNVLIQLSIFKNLIMLGELKMDPEAMRAMRIIESSYTPTQTDYQEKAESSIVEELPTEEGMIHL